MAVGDEGLGDGLHGVRVAGWEVGVEDDLHGFTAWRRRWCCDEVLLLRLEMRLRLRLRARKRDDDGWWCMDLSRCERV